MNTQFDNKTALDKATVILGTAMMLAWTLMIGIFGFVLMAAVAYGIKYHSHMLVTICSILLFSPLFMTIAWGLLNAVAIVSREMAMDSMAGPTWWERRQDHRILYQAYYL